MAHISLNLVTCIDSISMFILTLWIKLLILFLRKVLLQIDWLLLYLDLWMVQIFNLIWNTFIRFYLLCYITLFCRILMWINRANIIIDVRQIWLFRHDLTFGLPNTPRRRVAYLLSRNTNVFINVIVTLKRCYELNDLAEGGFIFLVSWLVPMLGNQSIKRV